MCLREVKEWSCPECKKKFRTLSDEPPNECPFCHFRYEDEDEEMEAIRLSKETREIAIKKKYDSGLSPEGVMLERLDRVLERVEDLAGPTMYDMVAMFHKEMGHEQRMWLVRAMERLHHMEEEVVEYRVALKKDKRTEQLDALVDIVYIVLGIAWFHGFDRFEEAFRRVHEANMKKKCRGKGDKQGVYKPEGWRPPVLEDLV